MHEYSYICRNNVYIVENFSREKTFILVQNENFTGENFRRLLRPVLLRT